jgi:type 1 glutamine amidotransferase
MSDGGFSTYRKLEGAVTTTQTRVLLHYGGWDGHQPERFADFAEKRLLADCDVVRSQNLADLTIEFLSQFDLLVPIWTFGELGTEQETALLDAVAKGLGVVAWHGSASAFLNSRPHKHLLGGQFVAHPGGEDTIYTVRFRDNDPLVRDLADFTLTSEQYYLLIDPAVKVLASTTIHGDTMPWLKGIDMPVAWTRYWGKGRVFYCSLGHSIDILEHPTLNQLLRRAIQWAPRVAQEPASQFHSFDDAHAARDFNNLVQPETSRI